MKYDLARDSIKDGDVLAWTHRATPLKSWYDFKVWAVRLFQASEYTHVGIALRSDGKCFPRLYAVLPWWFDQSHAVMIDIGWKIKLSHNGTSPDAEPSDRLKGSVFTPSLWKGL